MVACGSMEKRCGYSKIVFFCYLCVVLRNGAAVARRMYEVEIPVKSQMLADYLRWIFPPEPGSVLCRVSVTHPVGALMVALAQPAVMRAQVTGDHVVALGLPMLHRRVNSEQENKWLVYDRGAVAKINLVLEAEFDLEFAGYYRRGEQLGMRKMDIIDAFILSRGLVADTFDALSKRTYRREMRSQEKIRQRLVRRAYYINESIDYTGLFEK